MSLPPRGGGERPVADGEQADKGVSGWGHHAGGSHAGQGRAAGISGPVTCPRPREQARNSRRSELGARPAT